MHIEKYIVEALLITTHLFYLEVSYLIRKEREDTKAKIKINKEIE